MSQVKRIAILGSTGSVGGSTLSVVRRYPDRFRVVGLAGERRISALKRQASEFKPEIVVIGTERPGLDFPGVRQVFSGPDGLRRLCAAPGIDLVVLAIPGADSLQPALEVIKAGRNLALASKEALVIGGRFLMAEARKRKVRIIPLDSEHNALFQLLEAFPGREVNRVFLTASGGPFWNNRCRKVTVEDALAHPVWKMGRKITIDSATMVNKALEVIEAHYLFDLPPEKISVLVHPEVAVHALAEFTDGFTAASLSAPDMRLPIAAALFWPEVPPGRPLRRPVNLSALSALTFHKPGRRRFPALDLAYAVLKRGGVLPAVFAVADEEAVNAFLSGRLKFNDIVPVITRVLNDYRGDQPAGIGELSNIVKQVRLITRRVISSLPHG